MIDQEYQVQGQQVEYIHQHRFLIKGMSNISLGWEGITKVFTYAFFVDSAQKTTTKENTTS